MSDDMRGGYEAWWALPLSEKLVYPPKIGFDVRCQRIAECMDFLTPLLTPAAARIRELEAENKALREGRGVKVAPLEWGFDEVTYTHWSECKSYSEERTSAHHWSARPKATRTAYDIMEFVDARMKNRPGFTLYIGNSETRHDTLAEAKSAAQADYERHILPALSPAPVSVPEAARVLLDATNEASDLDEVILDAMTDEGDGRVLQLRAALRALAETEGE